MIKTMHMQRIQWQNHIGEGENVVAKGAIIVRLLADWLRTEI